MNPTNTNQARARHARATHRAKRDPYDRYYTPPSAARPMIEVWRQELRDAVVIEPCAGRGDLARELERAGSHVLTSDLLPPEPPQAQDLFAPQPRQPDILGDLLDPHHRARLRALAPQAAFAVTNPPFGQIAQIVWGCLDLAPRALVLVPWGWLGLYQDRAKLMAHLRHVVVVGRVNFLDPQGHKCLGSNRDQVVWAEFGQTPHEGGFVTEFWRKP